MDTFKEKLDIGLAGEAITTYYLRDVQKKTVETKSGFDRESDIIVNGHHVEIKTDVKAWLTHRIAIEHRSLETHTSPILIWLVPTFYWTTRPLLQAFVSKQGSQGLIGDDKRASSFLPMDSNEFSKIFKKI